MERYIGHLVRSTEKRTDQFLKSIEQNQQSPFYGGIKGDILEAKPTIYRMAGAAAVYTHPDSRYYRDEKLLQAMDRALDFIRVCQRGDGSFDYPSCNFKSAADTSFCFKRLIAAYRLLEKAPKCEGTVRLTGKYRIIMKDALKAIRDGGFHTPNHRWGIAAALMQGANLFAGDTFAESLLNRAKEYLQEGIDGNADGEYAERSTGNYNAVVNNSMMTLWEETQNEEYLGYMERNLQMMLTFIDPDDTIFTQNSTRQDQGSADYPDKYFYQYLYLAALRGIAEFDAAAHKIIHDNQERGDLAPDCLHIIMLNPAMQNYRFKGYGFLAEYRRYYPDSGVYRYKNSKYALSILREKSGFLYFKVGKSLISLKLGESFCDIRNFIPESLTVTEDGCILSGEAKGWYYQPFKEKPETSDWWKMDLSKRELLISSHLSTQIKIDELPDGIELHIAVNGIDQVPVRTEIGIPAESVVSNEHFCLTAHKGGNMILRDGHVTIHHDGQEFLIGPGYGTHEFKGHYSGEEKNEFGYTLYLNEYTPFEKIIKIQIKE